VILLINKKAKRQKHVRKCAKLAPSGSVTEEEETINTTVLVKTSGCQELTKIHFYF